MSNSHWIGGIHAVQSVLENEPSTVLELMLTRDARNRRLDALLALAQTHGIAIQQAPRTTLDRLAAGLRHQDVLAKVRERAGSDERDLPELLAAAGDRALFLVLDGVTDPHNLGACLRSAAAAGATAVIVPKDHSAPLNAAARKAAAGGAERVPLLRVTNLARTLAALKKAGVWAVGLAGEAEETLYARDLTGAVALVLGAEGTGMRRLTAEACDHQVAIPIAATMESLNVSVAAGICLFESKRQRLATIAAR
ncbi:MAG: 23S rRNA (guanosine(2251)-2'-O)-methyltransferase RlmB [Xanthomonadales bacterium]|nr:23S rRNA (guanosine(2251)-2'-O)-methyltransferase RlmB [Xanthomonadales bacterium]